MSFKGAVDSQRCHSLSTQVMGHGRVKRLAAGARRALTNQRCHCLHLRCSFSSQIPRKFTPETWEASAFSFLSNALLSWGSGLGEQEGMRTNSQTGNRRETALPQPASHGGGLDTKHILPFTA